MGDDDLMGKIQEDVQLTRSFYDINRCTWPEMSRLRATYSAIRTTVMVSHGRWWPKRRRN